MGRRAEQAVMKGIVKDWAGFVVLIQGRHEGARFNDTKFVRLHSIVILHHEYTLPASMFASLSSSF